MKADYQSEKVCITSKICIKYAKSLHFIKKVCKKYAMSALCTLMCTFENVSMSVPPDDKYTQSASYSCYERN
jgi:hypothetical protein